MKALIITLSLLFFVSVVRMVLQSYTYITKMYLLLLLEVVGKRPHRYEYIFSSSVVLGSTVVQYTTFVLILSSRSVSRCVSLVDCHNFLPMCRCTIFVLLDFPRCFLIIFLLGQVFRKPCFIALKRLAVVGMKSAV